MQTTKGTNFFCIFDKKMQEKQKQKQKQSKRLCVRDSPCRNLLSPWQQRQKNCLMACK
jgi:hypothetical protein